MILLNIQRLAVLVFLVGFKLVESFQLRIAVRTWIGFDFAVLPSAMFLHLKKRFELHVAKVAAKSFNVRVNLIRMRRELELEREALAAEAARELFLFLGLVLYRDVRRQMIFGFERRRAQLACERPLFPTFVLLAVVLQGLLVEEASATLWMV